MIEQYSPAWCMLHPFQASILACSVEEELGTQLKLLIQREKLEDTIMQIEELLLETAGGTWVRHSAVRTILKGEAK